MSEKELVHSYELKNSLEKGEGIFAKKEISRNEVVMIGEIGAILTKNNSHASQIGIESFAMHSGLINKVNHSCDPNCGIKVNKTGAHNFVAMKSIPIGEEITFDYAMRNYTVDHFPKKCLCGSKNCRGEVTGWKSLSNIQKSKYVDFIAPYLLEIDNKKEG